MPLGPSDESAHHIKIEDRGWALGGFDNALLIKVRLNNYAAFIPEDFVIACAAVADSGSVNRRSDLRSTRGFVPPNRKLSAGPLSV